MANPIADRLRQNSEKILSIWTGRTKSKIPAAQPLGKFSLRDSLPNYLNQLAIVLSEISAETGPVSRDNLKFTYIGYEHGQERAAYSHYSVDDVIFEFHLLREVIFEVLEETSLLPKRERDIIITSIEQGVNNSATQFAMTLREIQQKLMITVTHDLRTPITSAKLSAELILRRSDEQGIQRLANRITDNLDRVDEMIDDLLDSSRVRAGQELELLFEELNLTILLDDVLKELKLIFGDRIILKSDSAVKGYWSRRGLRRLIENLISNAVKYGIPDSSITVSLSQGSQDTKLDVHNIGTPIRNEDIPTLFNQFQRGESAMEKKGWGIGLTLVKGVTEAHHGQINVESSGNLGTTFTIILPNDFRNKSIR